jgi:hypothetical protein
VEATAAAVGTAAAAAGAVTGGITHTGEAREQWRDAFRGVKLLGAGRAEDEGIVRTEECVPFRLLAAFISSFVDVGEVRRPHAFTMCRGQVSSSRLNFGRVLPMNEKTMPVNLNPRYNNGLPPRNFGCCRKLQANGLEGL